MPERSHHFGLQAYGIPKSILAGAVTFGTLRYFQVGNPWLQGSASAFSAVLTSRKHVFDEQRTQNKFATTPLVAGRSVFSEELCPIVCPFYRDLMPSKSIAKGPDYDDRELYRTFAENCMRRKAFETKVRRDRGLADDIPISVPHPGVPADFPLHVIDCDSIDAKEENSVDASQLVLDQEQFVRDAKCHLSQNMHKKK